MKTIIALDAGHGYHTAGKRCMKKLDPDQTREWYLNDRIMDSPDDVPVILSLEHAEKTAQGVAAFLIEEFSLKAKNAQNDSTTQEKVYYPAYKGADTTLSIALETLGIDYSYEFRKKIAIPNHISGYRGTAAQNTHMYNLLVAGLLKRI